jgi:hypothetical protein
MRGARWRYCVIRRSRTNRQYGLESVDKEGTGNQVRKTTRFLTNSPRIAEELGRRCPGDLTGTSAIDQRQAGRGGTEIPPPSSAKRSVTGAAAQSMAQEPS